MEVNIQFRRGQYRILRDGSVRRYAADYGEIIGTKGADNDPLDVYRGLFDKAEYAFIINQYHHNGAFDEHKIMLNFYDEAQAKTAYELTAETPVREIFTCTLSQLNWWLQYGNHKKPVTQQSFPFDSENPNMTHEANHWTNESQTAAQLIYAWRKHDEYGELTEPATLDSIVFDEMADGAEMQAAAFDALVVENKRLSRTAQALGRAFNSASGSLKVVENGIQISAPMKKNGTTNIAVMYEMTDGQVVSVMFHNPDTTPSKITPDDMLVSWKWLLNRKDITIVVAKENGKDLPLTTVARRVMALVEKNTARFAKANANKAAETEELARLETEKAAKLARLEELNAMIAARENGNVQPENSSNLNVKEQPIEIKGNELGEFDTDTPTGLKALRQAAKNHLMGLRGTWVHNKHLDKDIEIRKRGIKETLNYSANPKKLKLLAAIEQIIATAKPIDGVQTIQPNYKPTEKPDALRYFHLGNSATVAGELLHFDVIIEEDKNGVLHYDIVMEGSRKEKATMDNLDPSSITNTGTSKTAQWLGDNHTAIFDDASSGYVLNLFVFDENGIELDDFPENQDKQPEQVKVDNDEQYEKPVSGNLNDIQGYGKQLLAKLDEHYSWNNGHISYSKALTSVAFARLDINKWNNTFELVTKFEKNSFKKGNEKDTKVFKYQSDKPVDEQAQEIHAYFADLMVRSGYPNARKELNKVPNSGSLNENEQSESSDSLNDDDYIGKSFQTATYGQGIVTEKTEQDGKQLYKISFEKGSGEYGKEPFTATLPVEQMGAFIAAEEREYQAQLEVEKMKLEQQQKAQAEKDEQEARNAIINQFADETGLSAKERGLAIKVLNQKVEYAEYGVMTRAELLQTILNNGGVIKEGVDVKGTRAVTAWRTAERKKGYPIETKTEEQFGFWLQDKKQNVSGSLNSETEKQQAIDYLNQIINGTIDGMADGVMDKVLEIAEAFEQDDDVNAVLAQAIAMIENKMPKNLA